MTRGVTPGGGTDECRLLALPCEATAGGAVAVEGFVFMRSCPTGEEGAAVDAVRERPVPGLGVGVLPKVSVPGAALGDEGRFKMVTGPTGMAGTVVLPAVPLLRDTAPLVTSAATGPDLVRAVEPVPVGVEVPDAEPDPVPGRTRPDPNTPFEAGGRITSPLFLRDEGGVPEGVL